MEITNSKKKIKKNFIVAKNRQSQENQGFNSRRSITFYSKTPFCQTSSYPCCSIIMKIAVIGAGVGGIATAILLSKKGHQVHVYESSNSPGGKLKQIQLNHYRFDAGPSLFTQPNWVISLLSAKQKSNFNVLQLETICNYFFSDGTTFSAPANIDEFIRSAANTFNENPNHIRKYISKYHKIYTITKPVFLENSLHKLNTYISKTGLIGIANLWRIDMLRTMNDANSSFFSNPNMVQLFNRYGTYNGSNPYQAPATLNVIPQLEMLDGAFLPANGMYSITETLFLQALENGVQFHFESNVTSINYKKPKSRFIKKRKITGITTNNRDEEFDAVVANVDAKRVYNNLLKQPVPTKINNAENSSSALIFYWGIKSTFPQLDVHNILFSDNYPKEFEHLFVHKDLYHDPTVYINITSKHCPQDAPDGCENWFVMINAPANYGQDWEKLRAFARNQIIQKLNHHLKCDIESLIEVEDYLDPIRIEERTGSNRGSLYGSSSNHKMSAFFRQANFSSEFPGLYFCGGSVHPGGGIPLCIQSANIVAKCIQ